MVAGVGVVNGIGVVVRIGVGVGVEVEVGEIERVEEWKSELRRSVSEVVRALTLSVTIKNQSSKGNLKQDEIGSHPHPSPNR